LPSPPVLSKLGNYFSMSPADDTRDVRGVLPPPLEDKSVREKVREVGDQGHLAR